MINAEILMKSYARFYGLIFFIALLFNAFSNMDNQKKKWYVIITFFIFFVVMAFKDFTMGNDTKTYVAFFKQISLCDSPGKYIAKSDLEPGYIWLNWIVSKYLGNVRVLFVLQAAFINMAIGRFVYKYVDAPGIFSCLFVGLTQFDFFLSTMRQGIAIAIFLYAFDALINKHKIKYIILCCIAMLFHYTAIIMLLVYPLISSKKIKNQISDNKRVFLILAIITLFATVFLNKIYSVIISVYPKYIYYADSARMDGNPRLAVFLKLMAQSLLFFIPKWLRGSKENVVCNENDIVRYNLGERLSMMNIAVMIISGSATAFMRFSCVFNLYANMQFANTAIKINKNDRSTIILLMILFSFLFGLVIVVLKTPEWQTTYPIKLAI